MPKKSEHRIKANKNSKFLEVFTDFNPQGIKCKYPGWAITVMFYTALHHVEMFLAQKNFHSRTHITRDKYISRVTDLRPIHNDYSRLQDLSRQARYDAIIITLSDVEEMKKRLDRIENHIDSVL